MAYVGPYTCSRCHEERDELVTHDHVCSHCRAEDAQTASQARRMALAALTGLTPEERLARIEAALYDLGALKMRIESLEQRDMRY